MQRAQSGAQAAQCGAVRALMRHWPVAAAAAVAWPIDAGSTNAGSVRALGGRARSACELARPFRSVRAARTGQSAASECTCTSMLGAGQVGRFRCGERGGTGRRATSAPRDGEEVGNHHSNGTYTSDPPAPRVGSEQGAGSADPTHRARETGRHNARLLEQASYLQVQSNNPACWSSLFSSSGAA